MPLSSSAAAYRAPIPKINTKENGKIPNSDINVIYHNGQEILLSEVLGRGGFGVVYKAKHYMYKYEVAIKQVEQDERYKNRELEIMKLLQAYPHENIIRLLDGFYTLKNKTTLLNLILELVPQTLSSLVSSRPDKKMKEADIICYMRQVFKALAHLASLSICHRDLKPENLLVYSSSRVLKLADFGSAKLISEKERNSSYICSRFYRAPELVFGATNYNNKVDVWSAACVLVELYLGTPLFPGRDSTDQILQIFAVLGIPTPFEIKAMNPDARVPLLPSRIKRIQLGTLLDMRRSKTEKKKDLVSLLNKVLVYNPECRLSASEILNEPFF